MACALMEGTNTLSPMLGTQSPDKVFSLSSFGEWGPNAEYLLDPDKPTIVLCHHGIRSAQVCQFLLKKNFNDLRNVTGGINAYCKIDPSVPEY